MEEARKGDEARKADEARRAAMTDPAVHHPGEPRLRDLEMKEKSGKISPEEKRNLERLRAERQKNYDLLAKTDAAREKDVATRRLEAQQALARYNAVAHDPAVHEEFQRDAQMVAELQRAKAVAQAEGRDDAVTRCDKLLFKEKARHEAWLAAHTPR